MENDLTFKSLGLTDYQDSYNAMKAHITKPNFENQIWLLEHPSVFTLGTAASKEHILDAKNIPVIQTDRGGEVTYHGPGQLVIYFLLDIKTLVFFYISVFLRQTFTTLGISYLSLANQLQHLVSLCDTEWRFVGTCSSFSHAECDTGP